MSGDEPPKSRFPNNENRLMAEQANHMRMNLPRGIKRLAVADSDAIRENNRRSILHAIRHAGPLSRVEIAQSLDLSPSTVTIVTQDLLKRDLIQQQVVPSPDRKNRPPGRPRVNLVLNHQARYAVGINVSMHRMAVSLINFQGDVVDFHTQDENIQNRSAEEFVELCAELVTYIIKRNNISQHKIIGVGIGLAGMVTYPDGVVKWSPVFQQDDVRLRFLLESRLQLAVIVENDINMVTLAIKWFGLGRQYPTFLLITVEHGLGMGLVLDGQIFRGNQGIGTEFAHTKFTTEGPLCRCGEHGCLEAYVADYALAAKARDLFPNDIIHDATDVHNIILELEKRAAAGDEKVQQILSKAAEKLGLGVANLVSVLNPPMIILAGSKVRTEGIFYHTLCHTIHQNIRFGNFMRPQIMVQTWGEDLWARGAGVLVLEERPVS